LYSDIRYSIVAVHGLGANPQYAWVAKVPANTGSTSDSISRYDPSVNSDIYYQPSGRSAGLTCLRSLLSLYFLIPVSVQFFVKSR